MKDYEKEEMKEEEEQEEETEGEAEGMYEEEPQMKHGMHGWGGMGWDWKKCGCPMCKAVRQMSMMGGMMPHMKQGMMHGGMGMPGMGMHGMGMMGMAPWRKFMSSEEKIAGLEKYLKDLKSEEQAVQEKIDHIRKKYEK